MPPPRIPVTADAGLFASVVALGQDLLWWHTYGQRFQPADSKGKPQWKLPRGSAKAVTAVTGLPDKFSYNEATKTLHVGSGSFGPVAPQVWDFDVSGHKVVQSWLAYRMRKRAGRSSSPLDEMRPAAWEFTAELLTLLDIIEHTLHVTPKAAALLEEILGGALLTAAQLPTPTDAEQEPPQVAREEVGQKPLFE